MSKRTPLLGARVSVLCPGSRSGLGEFDGGVGAQIPGKRRARDESALRYLRYLSFSCESGLDQGPLPREDVAEGGLAWDPGKEEAVPLLTCRGTTPWGGRNWGWRHCPQYPLARSLSSTWLSRGCCPHGHVGGGPGALALLVPRV